MLKKVKDFLGTEIKIGDRVKDSAGILGIVEEITNDNSIFDCTKVWFEDYGVYRYYDIKNGVIKNFDKKSVAVMYDTIEKI